MILLSQLEAVQCRKAGFESGSRSDSNSSSSVLSAAGYVSLSSESNGANPHDSSRGVSCLSISSKSCSTFAFHCNHCIWVAYSAAQASLGHPASIVLAMTTARNLLYGRRNDGSTLCFLLHDMHFTMIIRNRRSVPSSKYPCLLALSQLWTGPWQ